MCRTKLCYKVVIDESSPHVEVINILGDRPQTGFASRWIAPLAGVAHRAAERAHGVDAAALVGCEEHAPSVDQRRSNRRHVDRLVAECHLRSGDRVEMLLQERIGWLDADVSGDAFHVAGSAKARRVVAGLAALVAPAG